MAAKHGKPMQVKAYLEGCYGEPGVNVEGNTYDHFLLISGGIGITPMQVGTSAEAVAFWRAGSAAVQRRWTAP